jgi:predicted transposase YbfD/YdcC
MQLRCGRRGKARATAFTFLKKTGNNIHEVRNMDIEKLKAGLKNVSEPRRMYGNIRHKLEDIVIIGLLTLISMGEDFTDMEIFGKNREDWLKTFLELPNGIPDSDTFRRVYERLNPQELSTCLNHWLEVEHDKGSVINIDGKTICGSKSSRHKAYHVVSAWIAENQITLGEIKTEEKSNEISAVPELLDMLDVEGSIITADAMSCQTAIVGKITEKGADYVIGLKGNQETLRNDVELYFKDFAKETEKTSTLEKDHGRIEKREYFLATDIGWLSQKQNWANLNSIGMVNSTVEEKGAARTDVRYFISSLTNVNDFAYAVRKHWSIENQLHWCLDVVFREDSARARKDNSPLNMNVLRKTALPLLKQADLGRIGLRKKMLKAALDTSTLANIVFG